MRAGRVQILRRPRSGCTSWARRSILGCAGPFSSRTRSQPTRIRCWASSRSEGRATPDAHHRPRGENGRCARELRRDLTLVLKGRPSPAENGLLFGTDVTSCLTNQGSQQVHSKPLKSGSLRKSRGDSALGQSVLNHQSRSLCRALIDSLLNVLAAITPNCGQRARERTATARAARQSWSRAPAGSATHWRGGRDPRGHPRRSARQ